MVFRGNREGIDRQLTANEKGGGNTWFSEGTQGVLTAN